MASIYRAHCAVIFAIAGLSCFDQIGVVTCLPTKNDREYLTFTFLTSLPYYYSSLPSSSLLTAVSHHNLLYFVIKSTTFEVVD